MLSKLGTSKLTKLPVAHRISQFAEGGMIRVAVFVLAMAPMLTGCVRRTMTITTEPPNALVYLNDQEIGRTELSTDFLWYGDYDIVIRKEGFQTLTTNWKVKPPWYQIPPLDLFFEAIWPGRIHDQRAKHFVLEPAQPPTAEELANRALETRESAVNPAP